MRRACDLDLRSPDAARLSAADEHLPGRWRRWPAPANVEIQTVNRHAWDVLEHARRGLDLAQEVVTEGLDPPHTPDHDARRARLHEREGGAPPTVMLFVPSRQGHRPQRVRVHVG
ncbi:hypothetical protein QJS66_15060 [Kocuria rhizophila]|nr:hypothetical protein QJS66_15060 [Kocuria rhizophila]